MAYNGWSNYETWAVNLWLANEEPLYRDVMAFVAREIDHEDQNNPMDEQISRLGQRIKDYVTDLPGRPETGLWADLVGAALSEVDWDEIASSFAEA